jgi:hypothetical protein
LFYNLPARTLLGLICVGAIHLMILYFLSRIFKDVPRPVHRHPALKELAAATGTVIGLCYTFSAPLGLSRSNPLALDEFQQGMLLGTGFAVLGLTCMFLVDCWLFMRLVLKKVMERAEAVLTLLVVFLLLLDELIVPLCFSTTELGLLIAIICAPLLWWVTLSCMWWKYLTHKQRLATP